MDVCVLRCVYVVALIDNLQEVAQLLQWENGGHDEDELRRVKLYIEIKGRSRLSYND